MNEEIMKKLEEIVASAFNYAKDHEIASPIDLAQLGSLIRALHPDFSPQRYGHEKLRPLLEEMPDVVKVIKDDSISPPRFFGSYLKTLGTTSPVSHEHKSEARKYVRPGISDKLHEFAWVINQKWTALAALARPENWGEGTELPLLRSYIRYTFARLVYEKKIKITETGTAAAFNTGLVDRRFQPIYAFLIKNKVSGNQPWFLEDFCVAGENFYGKEIVKTFNPLPDPAYYFTNAADAFYDIKGGAPYIDWEHVIEENAERIPQELLERTTRGFKVMSCKDMSESELEQYKQDLSDHLKKDGFAYRMLIGEFNRALELALKKVRWNYKTAIPVYYPTLHKLSMLLPLCLLSEDHVDLALVVERTASGNYQGHTIYPLDWAYSNARLIARPDSEWLQAESISESCPV